MSLIRQTTTRPSGVQAPVEDPALSPRSGSWHCWKTGRRCCGARIWIDTPPMNSRWTRACFLRSARKCCSWPTGFSLVTNYGGQPPRRGADLLWRTRQNAHLDVEKRLPDGSYLSRIYASTKDRRKKRNGILVRVIDYRLKNVADAKPLYRLITTILDHEQAPAKELAALYHERWEIATTLDELKTHLRGAQIVLRSKTPELVPQ